MKSIIYVTTSIVLMILGTLNSYSQNPPQNIIDAVQSILDNQRTTQLSPGAVLSINKVGQWNYTWASGVRDSNTNEQATGFERFRVGSITKNFTATCILKLASQNILSIDNPISMWLSPSIMNVIPNGNLMTIRNLLNHTSGMADYVNDPNGTLVPVFISNPLTQFSIEDIMLTHFAPLSPTGLPSASNFSYTNTGFALLGKIIENASGLTYKQYCEQNIITPLNLTKTTIPSIGEYDVSGIHLNGYYASNTELYNDITIENTSWANSAGEIISSVGDLNTYYKNLLEGNIIPMNYVNMMTNFAATNAGYGFGCYEIFTDEVQWYGHNGGIPGYVTNMYYSPVLNTYVSNNFNYEDADINSILLDINTYLNSILGVETSDSNFVKSTIYPNPSANYIQIKVNQKVTNLAIIFTDILGKEVLKIDNYQNNNSIDISFLENGMYFVHSKNKIIQHLKFIKK